MNNFFTEIDHSYESCMRQSNILLEAAITDYSDFLMTEHYVSENVDTSLWRRVKEFFAKIIVSIKNFIKELDIKIQYTIREKQLRKKLKDLHIELREKKENGESHIEIMDVWNYRNLYLELNEQLYRYAKKFVKVKYTKTWQIENDIKDFDEIVESYSVRMEEASKKKIKVSIKKALNFVEDELSGRSSVVQTLNDSMREFQEMEHACETLKTKLNILGVDVIPRHVGFIQRIVNKISSFVRRFVTKFVMSVVFIFA